MTRAPHWEHQRTASRIFAALDRWSEGSALGEPNTTPGVLFNESDNVIPDVVWVSRERLATLRDEAGHLTGAPELVVEVLSPGMEQEQRNEEALLAAAEVDDRAVVTAHLERAKYPEFHGLFRSGGDRTRWETRSRFAAGLHFRTAKPRRPPSQRP